MTDLTLGATADESECQFGLGSISKTDEGLTVDIFAEFDRSTYERFLEAFNNAMAPNERFNRELIERNFQSYVDHEKFAATLIGLGREFGTPDRKALAGSVMSQIMNWLMSFRLYLDHAETDLKRRFGRTSDQVRRFEARTAQAFDQHVGYRFTYRFRNYVQHCQAPVSSIVITRPTERQQNPFIKQTAAFLLHRDELLRSYSGWGPVANDIEAMGGTFPLLPLAEEAMNELRDIDRLLLEVSVAEGARTISAAREALSLLSAPPEAGLCLFQFTTADPGVIKTISTTTPVSVQAVEQYERIASGEVQVGDLYQTVDPPPPPSFDPATVREEFRRDNRAVQVMSLWQAEGGGTPAFVAAVNRIMQQDRSVEPLITGLLRMTAVLLHMSAATLGVEPSGLLGGLLDIYGAQHQEGGDMDSGETQE